MQASVSVVLPPLSTFLSRLKPEASRDDESETADATQSTVHHKLKDLYDEIRQQDSENILNGDSESEWGAPIAAEIR